MHMKVQHIFTVHFFQLVKSPIRLPIAQPVGMEESLYWLILSLFWRSLLPLVRLRLLWQHFGWKGYVLFCKILSSFWRMSFVYKLLDDCWPIPVILPAVLLNHRSLAWSCACMSCNHTSCAHMVCLECSWLNSVWLLLSLVYDCMWLYLYMVVLFRHKE